MLFLFLNEQLVICYSNHAQIRVWILPAKGLKTSKEAFVKYASLLK